MTGQMTHFLVATILLSVLLLGMASFTGGLITAYGGAPLNTTNGTAYDLSYLSRASEVSSITHNLKAKLEASNQSQNNPLASVATLAGLGIDAASLIFQAPALFLGIFGGAATELGAIIPGSSVYFAPILVIPLIMVCTAFLAWLLGRNEI